jgi:hypothetical protein
MNTTQKQIKLFKEGVNPLFLVMQKKSKGATMKLKYIFIILFFFIFNSGCDRDLEIERHLKNEVQMLKKTTRSQNTKTNKLQTINSALKTRVAELSSKQKGGLRLEEKRKALIEKEANLKIIESDLLDRKSHIIELENHLREQENELTIKTEHFINNKQNLLKTIGESKQIIQTHKQQ